MNLIPVDSNVAKPTNRQIDRSGNDTLIQSHLRLVQSIARRVFVQMSPSIPMEDLVQIGVIALIMSARSFEDRGVAQFSTYASIRIRGAMIDELRRSATISRQALRARREMAAEQHRLASVLGRAPSDAEMASKLSMTTAAYRSTTTAMQGLQFESLDGAYSDHSACFADQEPDAADALVRSRLQNAVAEAISELPEREGLILQLFFVDELNLQEIGSALNLSGPRICQIKKVALEKLRRHLDGWQ